MEFGYTLVSQYKPNREISGIANELANQVELANEVGFDMVGVSEHHVTDDQYLNNEALLPYLSNYIGEMDIGTGICLLPYHHPVRIAEWGATVDVLTGGNFTLGVGQGYRDEEFEAFGIDKADALGRFVEGVQIIKKLWTEDVVSYDGRHYQLEDVSINPKPVQDPRPPILIGASNISSVERAARIADGWLGAHVPLDLIDEYASTFREERASTEHGDGYVSVGREAFLAETTEEAEAIVREKLMRKYERYIDWGQDEVFESDDFRSEWERLKTDRFLVGSPEDVIQEIERYREVVDPDRLGVRMQYQGLDFDDVRSSIELFGNEVIPAIES
ncbi:Flavin-dependent oxidoreductase, luciferase family (includes alkanesulfonate monooxygenase SsuD and methylene tetrahydromethanopterin reductase) [Natronorubrum sediminis]|uniref:Flavin-dependent oxidoreductase, luciferase family (Includes alkanesulfonate monooxygenase SsuD and methylene tetrahydromethanopterin reductase) n=1 Tax=Natronorubrum sediminis TaxID=640943 RepID=A0A1H6G3Y7_9EURY|nr:LLM class flavin-dependent oxidoreductase [Natronorubrum sediminis]SEH17806.1 Flavin-dependent oxidoreductase, luciferase family (includes alkanesulfonate monooxygenase SsuD and methylene tetrahydromethanopterin reductase) [Natronorubrum sediminis]